MKLVSIAYRAHHPMWAFEPLSGEGARLHGGRFNAVGVPALYLALSYKTAIREARQGLAQKMKPMTIVSYEVDCEPIADLSTANGRLHHGVELGHMACAWMALSDAGLEVPSWAIADRMQTNGFCGILTPSFAPNASEDDVNLVLFDWTNHLPNKVVPYDPEGALPKDQKSWEG